MILQQLGAEPFSAGAIGFGSRPDDLHLAVAGDPIDRGLAFAALLEFAHWFNPRFERPGAAREVIMSGTQERTRAIAAPQVVVPNRASIAMLGRLGRRLAYLPLDGEHRADPALVRLGQHLQFLGRHASYPGQQLVVALTDLLAMHWVTPQTDFERASLGALDAHIDPAASPAWEWDRRRLGLPTSRAWRERRARARGPEAAALAERFPVGPEPDGDDDARLEPLVQAFNKARAGRTAPAVVRPLLGPIEAHYRPLVERAWELLWHTLGRERTWPQAGSVARRWDEDREAYTRHLDWALAGGRWRTRQTPRQAAMTLRRREDAHARLLAEEACDDPLRMIPYLLAYQAVEGEVVRIDLAHREVARVALVRRPLLTLLSPDPCPMPRDRQLWWTAHPEGAPWVVQTIVPHPDGRAVVTLRLTTSAAVPMPTVGDQACFSIHSTTGHWLQQLPPLVP